MYVSKENAPIATIVAMILRMLAHPGDLMLFLTEEASYAVRCKRINGYCVGLAETGGTSKLDKK